MAHSRTDRRQRDYAPDIERSWAIYLRISKDDEQHGEGVARQERLCRQLLRERGLRGEIVAVYVDNHTSVWKVGVRRRGYEQLIDGMKNGTITGVLGYKSDRIYRQPSDLEDLIRLVGTEQPLRVAIECVRSGRIDLSTASGRTNARIYGAIAAGESEATSERLRDTMADKAADGKPGGGRRPFGYCDDKLTPHEIEAPVLVEMVERVAAGETLTRIAEDLNARGLRSSTGAPFTIVTVRQLVTHPRYIGRRTLHHVDVNGKRTRRDVAAADRPALVDEATWRRANALIAQRSGKRRAARRYLLTGGIVRCGVVGCGAGLVGRPQYHRGTTTPVYHCPRRHGVQVRAENVERLVTDLVIATIEGEDFARALAARTSSDDRAARAVEAAQAELEQLRQAKRANAITIAEYVDFKAAAETRLGEASQAMAAQTTSAAAGEYLGQTGKLAARWDSLTLDVRQAIVRSVLDYVDVMPTARRSGRSFDPDRIVPHPVV